MLGSPDVENDCSDDSLTTLAEHLDQALLLLDERVDAGGLAVEVVGDGALLLQRRETGIDCRFTVVQPGIRTLPASRSRANDPSQRIGRAAIDR